jgi:hypothetical protein
MDGIIFSQEAMRQQDDLVFPSYNFGSEPQHTQHAQQAQARIGRSQRAGVASGNGGASAVAAGATGRHAPQADRRETTGKVFSDPIHGTFRFVRTMALLNVGVPAVLAHPCLRLCCYGPAHCLTRHRTVCQPSSRPGISPNAGHDVETLSWHVVHPI